MPRHATRRHAMSGRAMLLAGLVLATLATASGLAWAFWSGAGGGVASATAATFSPAGSVTATSQAGTGTVGLSWSAAALSTGAGPDGYYLTRVSDAGGGTAAGCGGTLVTGTSCTDPSVPDGSYHYLVTAVYRSWTAVSPASNSVSVSSTRPSVGVEQAAGQADPAGQLPVRFTVTFSEPVVDFGPAAVTVGGTAPGSRSVTVTGSGSSYTVSIAGLTGSGTVTASVPANAVHDAAGAGNTASTSADNSVSYDPVAPTAPAPQLTAAITFGSAPTYLSSEPVTLTDQPADADSGVRSVSYYLCPATAGGCSASTGNLLGTASTGSYQVTAAAPLAADGSYRIVAVALDNAGNTGTSPAVLVAVDSTPPTASRPTVNGNS